MRPVGLDRDAPPADGEGPDTPLVEVADIPDGALVVIRCQVPTTHAMRQGILADMQRILPDAAIIVLPDRFTFEVWEPDAPTDLPAVGARTA